MPPLTSLSLTELLDAFASSSEPLPAGGSAAALTGAIGASLLLMVATLPRTRSGAAGEAGLLTTAAIQLRPIRDELTMLMERDSEAYSALLAAMRVSHQTEDERARRHEQILTATHRATEVPLETIRAAAAALHTSIVVAENGARAASGDVAAAVELLNGAVRAACHSVDSNLAALKDGEYVARVAAERHRLEQQSDTDAAHARRALATA